MVSQQGGMDIEEVAATHPEAIATLPVDPLLGLTDYGIREVLFGAGFTMEGVKMLAPILQGLYRAYLGMRRRIWRRLTLRRTQRDGRVICADAKMTLDENALYRQKRLAQYHEESIEDHHRAEAAASRAGVCAIGRRYRDYWQRRGTGDVYRRRGGACRRAPCRDFLDIGGGARSRPRVRNAVETVMMGPECEGVALLTSSAGLRGATRWRAAFWKRWRP